MPAMLIADTQALSALKSQVLWAAFAVSNAFGFIAQRTHFCTMGAISDVVNITLAIHSAIWCRTAE